ncbi:MAG: ABC transporter ATP-binding protein [Candidatus Binataceae bacterium]
MKAVPPIARRLFGYLWRYAYPHLVLLAVLMLLLSAANGAIPFLVKYSIDNLTQPDGLTKVRFVAFALMGLFILRAVSKFGSDFLEAYVGQRIMLDIRSDLNNRLQRLPLAFFNRTPTGTMVSRVINDVGLIGYAATGGVFSLFGDGASLLALIAGSFYLDWQFALIAFIVFPAATVPVMQFSKKMRKMTYRAQKQMGSINALLHETYQGNRVVKAFGMEEYERNRFNNELARLFKVHMRAARIRSFTSPLIEMMAACAIVAVIWFGTASILAGTRSYGSFAAFFAAMLLLYEPFKKISRTNNVLQMSLAAGERIFSVMDEPAEVTDDPDAIELHPGFHSIEFENVSFRYGEAWVLRHINLKIGAGQVVALVGMSGGGKSTIADLIPRFYDVQDGRILVDGTDVRRMKLSSLRAQIGIVTQHTFLFNDTVRANIAYGSIDGDFAGVVEAAKLANAHDFITLLPKGYDTMIGELGVRLSGGERQRLAIARALLKNAPFLILDEATSSLDSESERAVQEALERLMVGRTTLVIAHRLSTVRRADHIAVIVHGRVVEEGTHEELFAKGRAYRKLHDLQFIDAEGAAGNGDLAAEAD